MYLLVLNGASEGKCIKLKTESYIIGRSFEADIVFSEDLYVSGKHTELKYHENGDVTIADIGSKNGTSLLGEEVTGPVRVNLGDIFRVGHTFMKLTRRLPERYFSNEDKFSSAPEAIVVVDIVGSSKIAQALGDRVAGKVKNILYDKLNKCLEKYPSKFLKNTGDGFMIIFSKGVDAVKFSLMLMKDTMETGSYKGFHLRIGIHYGETYKLQDGDRRGLAVDMAFRIESLKSGTMHETQIGIKKENLPRVDRIFISEVVHRLIASHSSIKTRCIGYFDLKGFTGRHKIFEVLF